jgi:hypothetical protein
MDGSSLDISNENRAWKQELFPFLFCLHFRLKGLETLFFKGASKLAAVYGERVASGVIVLTYKIRIIADVKICGQC